MKEKADKELLIRYINDQCTQEELLLVKRFLQQPEWQEALEKILDSDFSMMEDQASS